MLGISRWLRPSRSNNLHRPAARSRKEWSCGGKRLQKILAAVQRETRRSQLGQFAKQGGIRSREVEARKPLHALLELRRHFLAQRLIPIQRHQMETHVRPAGDYR